jgi:hypothetical protein
MPPALFILFLCETKILFTWRVSCLYLLNT